MFCKKLSIIMPAYNEGRCVTNALNATTEVMSGIEIPYEIIVVNDHSTDDTRNTVEELSKQDNHISITDNSDSSGKGSAIRHGFSVSSGDLILFFDADLDLHPRRIPEFFSIMSAKNADMVVGSKCHRDSSVEYPFYRMVLSRIFRTVLDIFFRLPVRDTQTGMKLMRRNVADAVLADTKIGAFIFDLEFLLLAHHMGFKIVEAPIDLSVNEDKSSSVRLRSLLCAARDTFAVWIKYMLLKHYPPIPDNHHYEH